MKRYYLTPYQTTTTLSGVPVYAIDYHTSMHTDYLEVVYVPQYHNAHRFVTPAESYRNHTSYILSAITYGGLKRLRRQVSRRFGVYHFRIIYA